MKTTTQLSKDPYFLQFKEAYNSQFEIPPFLIPSNKLSIYKRFVWSASFFLSQWEKNAGTYAAGTIHRYNHIFHCNFVTGCSIGKIKSALTKGENPQITISFRKSPNLPAVCIVDFCQKHWEN